MKALSLQPQWAHFVMTGEKTVECRPWKTDYRGDLLICANAKAEPGFISGYALAVVELVDIEPFSKEHLEDACMEVVPGRPCHAWIFRNLRQIVPFPQKGKFHLFDVDDSAITYIPIPTEAEADAYYEKYLKPLYK